MEIVRDRARYSDHDPISDRWSVIVDSERVSCLWVSPETGEIRQVETDRQHRDRGYATALYRQAATEITIYHAPIGHRTDDGNRFAARTGGPELECTTCCALLEDADTYDDEDYR